MVYQCIPGDVAGNGETNSCKVSSDVSDATNGPLKEQNSFSVEECNNKCQGTVDGVAFEIDYYLCGGGIETDAERTKTNQLLILIPQMQILSGVKMMYMKLN